jgi:cobalt-zinc-cadmium efflux system outer membrane protein
MAEAERDAKWWSLRNEAAVVAARLAAAQARVDASRAHAEEVERLIEILRTREREGEGSRFDRLRAEQELWDTRGLATSAAIELVDAGASLTALLPRDVTIGRVALGVDALAPPPPVDSLVARAVSTRADLKALHEAAARAHLESEAARRARLPSPTLLAGLKRGDGRGGRERGGVFGVSVSLPLFDRGRREAARWAATGTHADVERSSIEHGLRSEIARASEALALRQAAVSQDAATAGEELSAIAEVAYREGEVGILELLDAIRTAARARLRSVDLRLEARLAQIALERAVGDVLWP